MRDFPLIFAGSYQEYSRFKKAIDLDLIWGISYIQRFRHPPRNHQNLGRLSYHDLSQSSQIAIGLFSYTPIGTFRANTGFRAYMERFNGEYIPESALWVESLNRIAYAHQCPKLATDKEEALVIADWLLERNVDVRHHIYGIQREDRFREEVCENETV